MIKTFRGLLADGDTERIRLSTNDGKTGYRVIKFQTFANDVTLKVQESVMQLFTRDPGTASAIVNFDNPLLLGISYWKSHEDAATMFQTTTIFDSVKFNQDIYITHKDGQIGESCNYYIELEKVTLDTNEATVATLKDMRGRE